MTARSPDRPGATQRSRERAGPAGSDPGTPSRRRVDHAAAEMVAGPAVQRGVEGRLRLRRWRRTVNPPTILRSGQDWQTTLSMMPRKPCHRLCGAATGMNPVTATREMTANAPALSPCVAVSVARRPASAARNQPCLRCDSARADMRRPRPRPRKLRLALMPRG